MKLRLIRGLGVVLVALITAQIVSAGTITYVTPGGSATTDGSVDARAVFTLGANDVQITLTNLLENPTADGQLISALTFNVSGATGAASPTTLTTTNSGLISKINSGGSYSAGTLDSLTHWQATEASTLINLTTLTFAKPYVLIIGPDDTDGFSGTSLSGTGLYSNANSSIIQHDPVVLGTATFNIAIAGVTTTSTLSNVVFQFGTTAGNDTVNGATGIDTFGSPTVPEPSTLVMWSLLAGVFGVGGLRNRLRRTAIAAH